MLSSQELSFNDYNLTILTVKMKVKFPCKMRLQHSSNAITEQVQPKQQSKFTFNQQVTIHEQSQKSSFDFSIILVTEKGSRYVSGVMKLAHEELVKSEGQKIIIPLAKCLDNEAYAEIKVNKVKIGKVAKRVSVSSTLIELKKQASDNSKQGQEKALLSPNAKKSPLIQTRSQLGLGGFGFRGNQQWDDTRSKGAAQTIVYKSSFLRSPKSKQTIALCSPKSKLASSEFPQDYELLSQRNHTTTQSEVYKEGYQKLKQKYKKESQALKLQISKRQQLQANENSFKMEIMRLKLKTEEQERIIVQKNEKVNQLQITISEIHRQDLDIGYLKEQNRNLQQKITQLTDTISQLRKQSQHLKKLNDQKSAHSSSLLTQLRAQLEASKAKHQSYTLETSQLLKQKTQQLIQSINEIKSKSSLIQLQKAQIQKLQAYGQNRIYEFERTLQQQKNASSSKQNQLKQKIQLIQRQKKSLQKQLSQSKANQDKIKAIILKTQYDKKVLQQQQKQLKSELLQLKSIKQKANSLELQLTLLTQDNSHLQKQLNLTNQSKELNLQQLAEQSQLKLNHYRKQCRQLQQRNKQLSSVKIQLQTQLQQANNLVQKSKRSIQSLNTQVSSLKCTLKESKHYSSQLQQQRLSLQNELAITNNKLRFGEQASKTQIQRYCHDLQRLKNQLQSQTLRASQLFQVKSSLQIQLNKSKIQLQYDQDKIDKLFSSNKQLQATLDHSNKEHQQQTQQLQQTINKQQEQIKHLSEVEHKNQLQKIELNEQKQTMKKEIKLMDEKLAHLEGQLKAKVQLITQMENRQRSLLSTQTQLETDLSSVKHQLSITRNDKAKTEKMLQLQTSLVKEHEKDIKRLQQEKEEMERVETKLREQLKRSNESIVKLEMRHKATDREYTRFKQLMHKTITTEYSKLPLINNVNGFNGNNGNTTPNAPVLMTSSPNPAHQQSSNSNADQSKATVLLNHQSSVPKGIVSPQSILSQTLSTSLVLSSLTSSITDSKTTLFKLIEHNKQLKAQLQALYQEKEQTSNKFQFTEIQLHRDIQELQQELNHVYEQKEEEIVNYDKLVSQLNAKLHEKQQLCDDLSQQVEQLEYAISSLKLDFQQNNGKNDKKVLLLKGTITELQEKIQFFKLNLSNQEDHSHDLQEKLEVIKSEKDELLELSIKQKLTIEQLTHTKDSLDGQLSQLAKQRKSLLEKFNQAQIQLNEEKQSKAKLAAMLQLEENKTQELKDFTSQLIKQKETIIRAELEKTDRILQLETTELQLKRDIEIQAEELQRIKSQLESVKESLRKQLSTTKSLNLLINEFTSRTKKLSEKLQEKQKQIQLKDEIIARLDKKYKELTEKNYRETLQLHSQIDSKYSENIEISKQMNQKVLVLQAKIQQLEHIKAKMHHQNMGLGDELLAERENSELLKREKLRLEGQIQVNTSEIKSLQNRNNQLVEEIQLREQQLSQLNERIIVLEAQAQALSKDHSIKLQQLNSSWSNKYNSLIQENDHRFFLVEQQRQLIRSQLEEKINELELSANQNRTSEVNTVDIKKNYDEKLKKVEQDRLNAIVLKNNEIKKLQDQNSVLRDNIKKLESAQKQNSELLENIRKRLLSQEKSRKESQEKSKQQKKLFEAQMNALIAKESMYKQEKQLLYQSIWSNERQVRKILQNYIKRLLDQCDNVHIDKITNSTKGLETEVVKAMTNKLLSA